jgi:hypothetical protein
VSESRNSLTLSSASPLRRSHHQSLSPRVDGPSSSASSPPSLNRTAAPAAGEFKDACRRRSIPPKVFSVGWYGSDNKETSGVMIWTDDPGVKEEEEEDLSAAAAHQRTSSY